MKKNYYAKALALTLAASMVPVPAFAEENNPQGDIGSSVYDTKTLLEENQGSIESSLQDKIDALPDVEELEAMTAEELEAVNAEVEEIYAALEESEDSADLNMEKLQAVVDFFTGAVEEQKINGIVVSTEAELRAAIAQAGGAEDDPTVIHIEDEIQLTSTLNITGKNILLKSVNAQTHAEITATDDFIASGYRMIIVGNGTDETFFAAENIDFIAKGNENNKYAVMQTNAESEINLTNCKLTGGYTPQVAHGAGAIIFGKATMDNVEICNNYGYRCGGLYTQNGAEVEFKNGSIHDNSISYDYAGGLYVNSLGHLKVENSKIYNNSATSGSAVFSAGRAEFYDCDIYGNKNSDKVIFVTNWDRESDNTLVISGCNFHDNSENSKDIFYTSKTNSSEGIIVSGNSKLTLSDGCYKYMAINGLGSEAEITTDTPQNTEIKAYKSYALTETDLNAIKSTTEGMTPYLDTEANAIKAGVAHTVTLNANYGDNAETKEVKGVRISLSADTFTREGYVLTGWNTSANGTGTAYSDSFVPTGDTTLYAQWKETSSMSGFCGDPSINEGKDVTWSYDASTGTLTISGEGAMADYSEISNRPWNDLAGIKKVVIGADITRVGNLAFQGIASVTDIEFEEDSQLNVIGNSAFRETSIETITIPKNVETIEGKCFRDTKTLKNVVFEEGSKLKVLGGIPEGDDTNPNKEVFVRCSNLTNINLPEGLQIIGPSCFSDCTNLKNISLPKTLTYIGNSALKNTAIEEAVIPAGVTKMYANTFSNTKLKEITIPDNVTDMETSVFADCQELTKAHVGSGIKTIHYFVFNGCERLKSVIFDGLNEMDSCAFVGCSNLDSVVLNNQENFKLNFTTSLKNADDYMYNPFYNSEKVIVYSNSDIPDNQTKDCLLGKGKNGAGNAKHCIAITNDVAFPSDTVFESDKLATPVKEGYIFDGWYEKDASGNFTGTAVTTPVSGKTYYAKWNEAAAETTSGFCGADEDGKNVEWSFNTVDGILTLTGEGAMKDFTLVEKNWDKTVDCPWEKYRDDIKSVSIDEKITHLGSYAFVNYKNLSYDITDLVNKANEGKLTFGKSVFDSCGNVTGHNLYINFNTSRACFSGTGIDGTLSFGPDVEYIGRDEEANDNVGYTFRNCQKITKLDFSKATGLKSIYGRSFEGMKGVTEIVFPENFIYKFNDNAYMDYVFNGNTNMKGSFDDAVFDITCTSSYAAGAFRTCTNMLGNVHFTDATTIIPESMFEATGANSVTISKNITTVNKNAFNACSSLAAIDATAVNQKITYNDGAFTGIADKSGAYFSSKDKADEFKSATTAYDASKTFVAVTNGGTFAEDTVFTAGKFATPKKDGFVFGGWFETEDCSGTAVTAPTAGKTYYAKWTQAGELTARAEGFTGDYDGKEHTVTITPSAEGAAITYSVDGGKTYSAVEPRFKNAGTYTVHYKVSKEGCLDVTDSVVVQINKIKNPVTITPSATSLRGGGTVTFTITAPEGVTVNNVICSDESIAVAKTEDGKYIATLPAGVAEYTFTVDADGDLVNNSYDDATTNVSVTRKKSGSPSGASAPTYSVSTGKTENGTISVTPAKAEASGKVTVTVKPDNGYQLDKVTVKDKDNGNVKLTKVSDNEYTFTMPGGKVSVDATFVKKDAADDDKNNAGEKSKVIKLQIGSRIVNVGNETVSYDVAPVIRNNRTLVPIRAMTETMGGKVDWNGVAKEVTLTIDGKEIKMTVGKTLEKYGVAPVIINGRTFVPVRFVADELGAAVDWDNATKTVTITKIEK